MKNLIQKIFLGIMIIVLVIFGAEIFSEFMANHAYYKDMFGSWENWKTIIAAIISVGVPTIYLMTNKEFSLKKFIIYLLSGLLIFSLLHMGIKDGFVGSGFIIYTINNIILFALGAYFIVGVLAFGTWISKMIIKFKEHRIQEMFLKFGIGLGALLLLVQFLMGFGLFHPIVIWTIFLGMSGVIWYMRKELAAEGNIVSEILSSFKLSNIKKNRWQWLMLILLIFSLMYYVYGFQLSFIPYSTAWDANHEYLYIPKVIAENFGILWGNIGVASGIPYLRHSFIAFWFSIGSIFSGSWLSPDTIAVSMNFLSGPLVLFFGLALINESIQFFGEKLKLSDTTKSVSFATGWMTLLLWLTSGMGAFLIFVDNKTDLGVMALTILAILSGFIFIRYIAENKSKTIFDKESLKYLITSGFLFALASMAKPTAFIDIVVFVVLLVALWINSIIGVGVGTIALGLMGILQPANAADFMGPVLGKWIVIIGLVIVIIGIAKIFIKNTKQELLSKKKLLSYIVIWGIALVSSLLIFKGPWLAYRQVINSDFGITNFAKGLFLSVNGEEGKINDKEGLEKKLLYASKDIEILEKQNEIDAAIVSSSNMDLSSSNNSLSSSSAAKDINNISVEQCLDSNFTKEQLDEGKKEAVVGNEDVGRYVGYGWKTFTNKRVISYNLLRLFYPKNDICYGANSSAKVLCKYKESINIGDINKIEEIEALGLLKQGGEAEEILQKTLANYKTNSETLRDGVMALKQYYENHSIYTEKGKINVPYRYIVPLNITFNRSLQNLSSYYTDIGFIWMFVFIFTIFGLIYSIIKKDQKLFALSFATVAGRAIWRVIGGAILWYGIGLMMWTIIILSMFIQNLMTKQDDETHKTLILITLGLLGLWMIVQIFFNFIRISSQGASGPFLWFKQSVGTVNEVNDNLKIEEKAKIGYSQKDVFDLQFPHYNGFIEQTKDRADSDGVLIAGTYLQYFLKNQKNIRLDGMLGRFWEQGSDGNTCKTYHRLKNENLKYLVIDPNIATVVMGEGNESLFHRFFAKLDPVSGKVLEKGSMTMLSQLVNDGYAKLFYSNNLGAKYGFGMSDDDLMATIGQKTKDELIYFRAQLAAARFMTNSNDLVNTIAQILNARVGNGKAIGDIADVYGKKIDEGKVINTMNVFLSNPGSVESMVSTLTQDERFVFIQYLNLYTSLQQNNSQQYQEMLNNIMMTSLAGGSQLIVFELR